MKKTFQQYQIKRRNRQNNFLINFFYQLIFITLYKAQKYSILFYTHQVLRMRPHSAKQTKTVLFNQLSGQYYMLGNQGKQIKVNKRGDLTTKFTNDFTGFFNFKERKHRSMRDKALMYNQPKIDYDKENGFICPIGTKFSGYAQSPYNLRGQIPQFLGESTFKQTCETKNQEKTMRKQDSVSSLNPNNSSVYKGKKLNKFQSLKLFRTQNSSNLNFDLIKDKVNEKSGRDSWSKFLLKRQNTTEEKVEKSIILKASQSYGSGFMHKRIKSTNTSSAPSLHKQQNQHKSIHQMSYFEQSLSNIERTQTPNYTQSNFTYTQFASNTFNQTSVKPKCYKSSCHYMQYVPKRRYVKGKRENNTVNIGEYRVGLDAEQKQKKLVYRLKEELKIYQPVVIEAEVRKEEDKKTGQKDKGKKQVQNGTGKK